MGRFSKLCRFVTIATIVAMLLPVLPVPAREAPPVHATAVEGVAVDAGNRNEGVAPLERIAGADRYETAVKISRASRDAATHVVIATGERFPDALSGGPLASALNAPLLLVRSNSVPSAVLEEITRLGATSAVILGSTGAVSADVEATLLQRTGVVEVTRVGGENRYETSALIADELARHTESPDSAMIATGANYPDALALAPYAAHTGSPILLVRNDSIPARIAQVIGQLDIQSVIIAGGPNAISAAVEEQLPAPVRLGGPDRYETARLIAEHGTENGLWFTNVTVASGTSFADALTAGPFSASLGGPLVLTAAQTLSPATQFFVESHCASIDKLWVAGGPTRVSEDVAAALQAASLIEIPDTTVVLDEATIGVLQGISEDGAVFTFSSTTPLLDDLRVGDLIVSGPTGLAPMGLLRKVTSVDRSSGVVVGTVQGTIEEALGKASVDLVENLDPTDPIAEQGDPGVRLVQPQAELSQTFSVQIDDVTLVEDDGVAVRLNGEVAFESRLIMNVSTKWLRLNSLVFKSELEQRTSVSLTAERSLSLEHEKVLKQFWLSPITVVVAGCPVVFTPVVSVVVGVDGEVSVGVTTGVTQTSTYAAGVAYEDGRWRNIAERSASFTYTPPDGVQASIRFQAYAGPKISLLIYGVAGPQATMRLFLELTAQAVPISWQLDGGLKCGIGVEVSLFGWLSVGYEATVIDYRRRIAGSEDAGITGLVTNAARGTPVAGVDVVVQRNGARVASGRTSSDGTYTIAPLPVAADYSVTFSRIGYVSVTRDAVEVVAGLSLLNASLVPLNDTGITTIVLTWGESPWDLDSHLTGPAIDGSRFHTYYSDRTHYDDEERSADLDVDDTTSYGPETTTIYRQLPGVYRYSVHDYTNRSSSFSTALAASGAEVHVYRDNAEIASFIVPPLEGTLWTVFELDGDRISPVNAMSYESNASSVQGGPVVTDVGAIRDTLREAK